MQREYQGTYRAVNQSRTQSGAFGSARPIPTILNTLLAKWRGQSHRPTATETKTSQLPQEIRLQGDKVWSAVHPSPTKIAVQSGIAWVTQSSDGRDYLLHTGEEVVLPANRRIVVSSLEQDATVQVQSL